MLARNETYHSRALLIPVNKHLLSLEKLIQANPSKGLQRHEYFLAYISNFHDL
jgi:hypothetical protein